MLCFFNIAQAYLGLVDYEHATAWLELYVRLLPESAAEQQSLVDALGTQPGLEAEPPRFRVSADGKVEFEIGWIDPKNSGGSR